MTNEERDILYSKCNPFQAMAWLTGQAKANTTTGDVVRTILAMLEAQRAEIAALKPLASPVWPEGGGREDPDNLGCDDAEFGMKP